MQSFLSTNPNPFLIGRAGYRVVSFQVKFNINAGLWCDDAPDPPPFLFGVLLRAWEACPEMPTAFPFPIGLSQVPLNCEGVPGTSYGLPCFGSWPSVLSVPQSNRESPGHPKHSYPGYVLSVPHSHWESPGHPKDSHGVVPVFYLSHSLTRSPWDIPRTPNLGIFPTVLSVPQSHWESLGHPKDIQRTPTIGSIVSVPHRTGSFWDTYWPNV